MLYVIYALDAPDSAKKRAAARPAHLARLSILKNEGRLELVGPMPKVDAPSLDGGVSGSLIVAEFEDLAAAKAWAASDPYREAGVYATVDVRPFIKVTPA